MTYAKRWSHLEARGWQYLEKINAGSQKEDRGLRGGVAPITQGDQLGVLS